MSTTTITLEPSQDIQRLTAILRDADESEERVIARLSHPQVISYLAQREGRVVGAASLHWRSAEGEILYIAVLPQHRGGGLGAAIIEAIVREATQRGCQSLLVGTANSSLGNIAFYQKCGFRMVAVRPDYFADLPQPACENGIRILDMLVFRRTLP